MTSGDATKHGRRRVILIVGALFLLAAPVWTFAQLSGMTGDAVENVGQGSINWTSGEVFATGIGAPPSTAVNPAQARAMAERAAFVVALRNLLEIVKGVRVDSESVVENFMVKSDVIKTRVDGVVRGAMPVKKQYLSDGSVEITVSMKMRGALLDAIVPEHFGGTTVIPAPLQPAPVPSRNVPDAKRIPQAPPTVVKPQPSPSPTVPGQRPETPKPEPSKPVPAPVVPQQPEKKPEPTPAPAAPAPLTADQSSVQFKGGKATGIVIDGRGLGLRPALLPKVVDPEGQEIYVGQVVTRTNAVEQGVAGYAKDVSAAANNFRVTDNPAVIRGMRSAGAARTDIMLAQADAQKLRELSRDANFLQYCRVIIVY
jgi:hypothetical protein